MTPSTVNKPPIGMRISSELVALIALSSEEGEVQRPGQEQHHCGQNPGALIPAQGPVTGARCQRIHQPSELVRRSRAGGKAYHDGDHEARSPGDYGGPESLGQLARIAVQD